MFLNIDIFSSTDKWAISDHFFDVFSGQDARIELNPFAVYQAPWDTSLEYPHGLVWNILKINFFRGWPPLERPLEPIFEKKWKCSNNPCVIEHHIRYLRNIFVHFWFFWTILRVLTSNAGDAIRGWGGKTFIHNTDKQDQYLYIKLFLCVFVFDRFCLKNLCPYHCVSLCVIMCMTPHLDSHSTTDLKPEILSAV